MLKKIPFVFICFGLFLNQAGRIDIGNNIAFTILDVSVAFFLLSLLLKKETWQLKFSKDTLSRPFLIFVLIALLSLLYNLKNYTVQQDLVAGLYLLRFVMYCLMYPLIKKDFAKDKKFIVISLSITAAFILLAGLMQYFFYSNLRNLYYLGWDDHLYRLFSTFFDPNFAGTFIVLIFLFFVTLFLKTYKNKNKKLSISLATLVVFSLVEIFLTFSRSSLIMLFMSSFVYLFYLKKLKYILAIIVGLICIYVIVSPSAKIENTNYFRIVSTEARLTSEETAFQIIAKNPIFGVGFDAYRYAQVHYGYRSVIGSQTSHADSGTDNSFLFVFATTGILGFIAYLFLQWKIIKTLYREYILKKQYFPLLLLTSFIGLYINSFFLDSLFYPSIILWMMIVMGIRDYM